MKYKKQETICNTTDDWHPNYPNNKVRVACMTNMDNNEQIWHRVCVWGADDDGMEIDFFGEDKKNMAEKMYESVCSLLNVNKNTLKKLGFVRA